MSNVQQLSTIFKLDLAKFISTDLDSSNFLQYSSVASEIIQALVSLNSDELQVSADKIISLCLPELFSNQSEQNDLLLLNYIRQSSSHCSAKTFNQLFITFLAQFTRLATSKDEVNLKSQIPDTLSAQIKKIALNSSASSTDQITFMDSLFTIISKNPQFQSIEITMIEFHIDLSLNVLHDLTDDPATSNLCVKIISNIARQSNQLKDLVLNKTFSKLEETSTQKGCPNNNSINNRKRLENFIQDANLSLLTSLAEFLLPVTDNPNPEINYLKLTRFWELIQNGLVHSNSLTRKRALYLLKRATDTASLKRLNVDACHLYNLRATCWTNFFLCIEMMEETSVHIIKPCLPIVSESLVPAVVQTGELHFTWVLVLLSRAFLHESKFIVRWAMRTFLQSGLKIETDLDYEFMNRFLLGPFMGVLQKGFLYQKAEDNLFDDKCPKIAGLVADFFGQYVGGMPTEMMKIKFLTDFTQAISEQTWSSTSLLFLCGVFRRVLFSPFLPFF